MALMGLLPMAAKKLRKKGYRPLAMLSPAAMAMGMHKKDKMKPMKTMKGGGMNKQMGYKGGGMNPGMMALKKERPDVAKKMGYNYGGKVKKMMGGGMTMKDKQKMMGYMGGGMAMKKMKNGGMAMGNKTFNPKCDGMAKKGKTRARMV